MRIGPSTFTGVVLVLAAACSAAPSQRPVTLGPVDTGPGSIEYARRELEGAWSLTRLEVFDEAGRARVVASTGVLTVDEFGNIAMSGRLLEALTSDRADALRPVVEYSGRLVIDPRRGEFRLMDAVVAEEVDAALARVVDPSRVRQYVIAGDELTVSVVAPDGMISARTTFLKRR